MSNVQHVRFSITIHATPATVWHHITDPDSYRRWAAAFAEGSSFRGSWEAGARIDFLSPSGDGMISEIAESRRHEFLSIRHLGYIIGGVPDTTSASVRSWAPVHENYTLRAVDGGTEMIVDQDLPEGWEEHVTAAWPKALQRLKEMSESSRAT